MTDVEFETYTRSLLNDSPAAMWSGAVTFEPPW